MLLAYSIFRNIFERNMIYIFFIKLNFTHPFENSGLICSLLTPSMFSPTAETKTSQICAIPLTSNDIVIFCNHLLMSRVSLATFASPFVIEAVFRSLPSSIIVRLTGTGSVWFCNERMHAGIPRVILNRKVQVLGLKSSCLDSTVVAHSSRSYLQGTLVYYRAHPAGIVALAAQW